MLLPPIFHGDILFRHLVDTFEQTATRFVKPVRDGQASSSLLRSRTDCLTCGGSDNRVAEGHRAPQAKTRTRYFLKFR
jgi:hypothetical protein